MSVAREELSVTEAWSSGREQIAGPHVHRDHTDAFYVLEGELTFQVGRESETFIVSSGGLVAAPPEVAHSFRNDSDRPARWLTIHAHDGGFASFIEGRRDGIDVEWDISAVSADGACPPAQLS
jgi:mannose-6-phosphate isomerase-like protein (cupin superfamily)